MHPFFQNTRTPVPPDSVPRGKITVYSLDALCVLSATGEESLSFLQGQITNDLAKSGQSAACLAGYCTAQGRLLATAVFMQLAPNQSPQDPNVIAILLRRDIAAAVTKRLSMFILRAKVKITPSLLGVAGVSTSADELSALQSALGHELPVTTWQATHTESGSWISAPSEPGTYRWWWLAQPHADSTMNPACNALSGIAVIAPSEAWRTTDIRVGLPWIEAKTQDLFIPQTLNLDLIQGVSFTKGCYPGQEIVARSHYRGTLKRRMTLGKIDGATEVGIFPGADVFEGDEPCGRIINISTQGGTSWVLFEAPFDAIDRHQLTAGSAGGPRLVLEPLPYAIRPAA